MEKLYNNDLTKKILRQYRKCFIYSDPASISFKSDAADLYASYKLYYRQNKKANKLDFKGWIDENASYKNYHLENDRIALQLTKRLIISDLMMMEDTLEGLDVDLELYFEHSLTCREAVIINLYINEAFKDYIKHNYK